MSAVTLIDEVNTAGVPSDTGHGRICGARGGLKSPEWIHFCVQHFPSESEETGNWKICFWPQTEMTAALK